MAQLFNNLWCSNLLYPGNDDKKDTFGGGGRGFKWLDWCSDLFFKSCKNDKRNSDLFFEVIRKRETRFKAVFQSNAKRKNEKRNSYPFFKVMRKRKTKTEIHIRFSKRWEKEIRSSKPFFKVSRKRKAKSKMQICFSMSYENEKWKWHLNPLFPCHRKTVGTKVHALNSLLSFPTNAWIHRLKTHRRLKCCLFWDKECSDSKISQNRQCC